jgi:CheY-like chemotaxis protein
MIRLRCAPNLLDILRDAPGVEDGPKIASRLGDWSATTVFSMDRTLVLALNDATLFPLAVPLEPRGTFLNRFRQEVWTLVAQLTQDPAVIWSEAEALVDIDLVPLEEDASSHTLRRTLSMLSEALLDHRAEGEESIRGPRQALGKLLTDEPLAAAHAEATTSVPANRLRVLIVDDLKDCADSLAMFLRAAGLEVLTAYGGEEALDLAERFKPRVVTLDIGMPRLNGYDTCRHLRRQPWGKDVVVIALTGWGQERDRRMAEESGFDHYLVKPADPGQIVQLVESLAS